MDGVNIGYFCCGDNCRYVEITIDAGRRADTNSLICKPHMEGVIIYLGIDGNGAYPQLFAGPDNPQGNFTAVGYQYFGKHFKRVHRPAPKAAGEGGGIYANIILANLTNEVL